MEGAATGVLNINKVIYLVVGWGGVGKTELAKALANNLFNTGNAMVSP